MIAHVYRHNSPPSYLSTVIPLHRHTIMPQLHRQYMYVMSKLDWQRHKSYTSITIPAHKHHISTSILIDMREDSGRMGAVVQGRAMWL